MGLPLKMEISPGYPLKLNTKSTCRPIERAMPPIGRSLLIDSKIWESPSPLKIVESTRLNFCLELMPSVETSIQSAASFSLTTSVFPAPRTKPTLKIWASGLKWPSENQASISPSHPPLQSATILNGADFTKPLAKMRTGLKNTVNPISVVCRR